MGKKFANEGNILAKAKYSCRATVSKHAQCQNEIIVMEFSPTRFWAHFQLIFTQSYFTEICGPGHFNAVFFYAFFQSYASLVCLNERMHTQLTLISHFWSFYILHFTLLLLFYILQQHSLPRSLTGHFTLSFATQLEIWHSLQNWLQFKTRRNFSLLWKLKDDIELNFPASGTANFESAPALAQNRIENKGTIRLLNFVTIWSLLISGGGGGQGGGGVGVETSAFGSMTFLSLINIPLLSIPLDHFDDSPTLGFIFLQTFVAHISKQEKENW